MTKEVVVLGLPIAKEGYEKRKRAKQLNVEYGLFIYKEEKIFLTKQTKTRKGITTNNYTKENRKSYKNLEWLDKMYKRKMKDKDPEDQFTRLIKVIMPLTFSVGFKLYDHNEEYYGTILEYDEDSLCYVVIKKDIEASPFLPKKLSDLYVQAAAGSYGFKIPLEHIKDFERKD